MYLVDNLDFNFVFFIIPITFFPKYKERKGNKRKGKVLKMKYFCRCQCDTLVQRKDMYTTACALRLGIDKFRDMLPDAVAKYEASCLKINAQIKER